MNLRPVDYIILIIAFSLFVILSYDVFRDYKFYKSPNDYVDVMEID